MDNARTCAHMVEPLSTPGEAGLVLRLTEETVRHKLRSGEIRGVKIGNGPSARWRIPAAELERFTGQAS